MRELVWKRLVIIPLILLSCLSLVSAADGWDYSGPKRVGVVSAAHDGGSSHFCETNDHAVADIGRLGIRAAKLWPHVSFDGPEMANVLNDPNVDVLVLRPVYESEPLVSQAYPPCSSFDGKEVWEGSNPGFEPEVGDIDNLTDFGEIAAMLYANYGHLHKVIILTNWEGDWQITRGFGDCDDTPSEDRVLFFKALVEDRQAGVAAARAANPTANLKVYHALEVNFIEDDRPFELVRDLVPNLSEPPDFISVSAWVSEDSLLEALNYVRVQSGLPNNRIFLGEWTEGDIPALSRAFGRGMRMAFIWMYRCGWSASGGLWEQDVNMQFTGDLNPRYYEIVDLITTYEDCAGNSCGNLPWECGTEIWCNEPFQCGEDYGVLCNQDQPIEFGICAENATCSPDYRCLCDGTNMKWQSDYHNQAPYASPTQPNPGVCLVDDSCLFSTGSSVPVGSLVAREQWLCASTQIEGRQQGAWFECEQTRAAAGVTIGDLSCMSVAGAYRWVSDCSDTCESLGYQCGTHTICGIPQDCGGCPYPEVCSQGQCECPGTATKWQSDYYGQFPYASPTQPNPGVCLVDDSCLFSTGSSVPVGSLVAEEQWLCASTQIEGRQQGAWFQCEQTRAAAGVTIGSLSCSPAGGGYRWISGCPDTCESLGYQCGTHTICGIPQDCGGCPYPEVCSQGQCECPGTATKWQSDYRGQDPYPSPVQPNPEVCLADASCLFSGGDNAPVGSRVDQNQWLCGSSWIAGAQQGVWFQCEATRAATGEVVGGYRCTEVAGDYEWSPQ